MQKKYPDFSGKIAFSELKNDLSVLLLIICPFHTNLRFVAGVQHNLCMLFQNFEYLMQMCLTLQASCGSPLTGKFMIF